MIDMIGYDRVTIVFNDAWVIERAEFRFKVGGGGELPDSVHYVH